MKLCPNCENPFEQKAGLLYCAEHGWHGLNEAGEIVPADEPSAEEIAAWQAAQAAAAEKEKPSEVRQQESAGEPETVPQTDSAAAVITAEPENTPRLIINDNVIYTAAIVIGLAVIGLAVYGMYKKSKRVDR